jgi:3-deoxy-7-phosphoheptulonate synthase
MILILDPHIHQAEIDTLCHRLKFMGFDVVATIEEDYKTLALVHGVDQHTDPNAFIYLPFVKEILPFTQRIKLASRAIKKHPTIIDIKGRKIGGGHFSVMAGPCAIESEMQIHKIANLVSQHGATTLRGGAFKPRTSPYDFQGLGEKGLQYMRQAADKANLLCISEVMSTEDVDLLASYVDILQIGARNMQNFNLLKRVGQCNKPVMLKRGLCATYNEFLLAAEYILSCGNPNVILCERGIRTFETYARNCLDIAAVPILRELTHLPIVVDPSHGTGLRHVVAPMAKAAMAVGADGIMIEAHYDPDHALSDAKQTLSIEMFANMMAELDHLSSALGYIAQPIPAHE